ncbi:AAA family ATPase [Sunxiuqinia elliptica]|uniref:Putative AbiEii toxin of type IV toxin-antitoxin system n=1 Tax=Sunxiuqinia elliptica TaxID=655355 RepID=A0A4R6HBT4_9BACT|nr:AAA family ATPase [Sunxiuqinia elliptica]TDO05428.1 putative AbiEii toxin of type IV toxin-antitoxin system [Sunxiuqinia elliptica]TDO64974.1 putative AbiEii toxin of type IV toxin-antitoxin system [Sunxiuqinia elliptica]
MKMQEIHEQVFEILDSYRREVDSKLYFVLRKNNIGGYLDQGFYFPGDESRVYISFWNGYDIVKKCPILSVVIEDDRVFFEYSKDNRRIDFWEGDFIERVENLFRGRELYENLDNINFHIGQIGDLKHVLYNFIRDYKNSIDNCIKEYLEKLKINNLTYRDIGPINPSKFRSEFRKIIKYREYFKKSESFERFDNIRISKPVHLNSFLLKNFSIINEINIQELGVNNRWSFFVGENGSGKTLVMRALSLALSQNLLPSKYINKRQNSRPYFELELFNLKSKKISYERDSNSFEAKYARTPVVIGFAAYGIFRHEFKNSRKNLSSLLNKKGMIESIMADDNIVPLLSFSESLSEWNNNKRNVDRFNKRQNFLVSTLIEIIPELVDVRFHESKNRIETDYYIRNGVHETLPLKYNQLSSGTRSILSLVGDIFIRFYKQQPEIYDPSEFRGIVLIDEIDLHLHPKGQRDLVYNLSRIFPNVQFFVSTHSPIPLLGAPFNSAFFKVFKNDNGAVVVEKAIHIEEYLDELLPNQLLTSDLFGLDSISAKRNRSKSKIYTGNTMNDFFEFQRLKTENKLRDADNESFIRKLKDRLNEKNK